MNGYVRPQTLNQALAEMAKGQTRLLAGGTDIFPGTGRQLTGQILDVSAVTEMRTLSQDDTHFRIGAAVTWTEIATANLPPSCRALQQAARQIGSTQVQNVGTIGGNLCNASPAADGAPALLILDAKVELTGISGARLVTLSEFLKGPRNTDLRAGEIMTAILLPKESLGGTSAFIKLGARAYLVISIAMVAARLVVKDGKIAQAAVSIGACSATARRQPDLEATLVGLSEAELNETFVSGHASLSLSPIDDIRASALYRADAANELILRCLKQAMCEGQL